MVSQRVQGSKGQTTAHTARGREPEAEICEAKLKRTVGTVGDQYKKRESAQLDMELGDISPRKRARLSPPERRVCGSFLSSFDRHVRSALHASAIRAAGVELGARIQVLWTISRSTHDGAEEGEGEEDEEDEDVWWSCTVESEALHGPASRPAHRLRYDSSEELGFDEETRDVAFLGANSLLVDLEDGATMPWRFEEDEAGAVPNDMMATPVLSPGTRVKAHYQGGDRAYAGRVHAVRYSSSDSESSSGAKSVLYDILYEDHVLEEGVPAELVKPTDAPAGPPVADDDIAATSIDDFFLKFVQSLMGGRLFGTLSAAQRATFAECVQRSRPHFETELNQLAADRGYGTTVTADDITHVILPKVMPHVVAEFKAVGAAH
jgi:hypothetical protein